MLRSINKTLAQGQHDRRWVEQACAQLESRNLEVGSLDNVSVELSFATSQVFQQQQENPQIGHPGLEKTSGHCCSG